MARKPKLQPSTETAVATPVPELAAAPSPALPLEVRTDDRTTDAAQGGGSKAGSTKTPGRRGSGRKQKQGVGAEANPSAAGLGQGRAKDDAPVAEKAASLHKAGARDAGHGGAHAGPVGSGAVSSAAGPGATARAAPAARWDQATDTVEFDWPAIERMAAHGGPNQGTAKLLVAARAEGAGSRWPL